MPIDFLFRSLAEEKREAAIGIVLSGSGSDGTIGLRAIHGAGGITIVQEPASANYSQMPESAISTGIVDRVVAPGKIGELLEQFVQQMPVVRAALQPEKIEALLGPVFGVLRATMGHDFSLYKTNTVLRRISRRMNVVNVRNPREYVRYLEEHREEVELLFRDLLIKVTSFFRDQEGFKMLEKEILPRLLSKVPEGNTVRVWVPGCSTGEEAYSIAIMLEEIIDEARRKLSFQIFATDLDEPSVAQARLGLYPLDIATDVSEERLSRFFMLEERGYRVRKELRERMIFAVQDILKDPPFTKLDLLSCRNLMIYLRPEAQKKLVEMFHYSLRPGGLLFLGSSETIGNRADLFETLGRRWKFFEARPTPRLPAFQTGSQIPAFTRHLEPAGARPRKETTLREAARREILDHFSPPSVVVDSAGTIVFFHGQTGRYLEPTPGEARFSVYDMAKEGVRFGVHSALHQAMTQKTESVSEKLTMKTEAGPGGVRVKAKPLSGMEGCYMVVFEEVILPKPRTKSKGTVDKEEDNRAHQLEEELRRTRTELQTSIEEYQSAIEEQKSTSEELQSSNEELQSTNEELETSKEELQSINEELITVNTELEAKIQQLALAESDMKNLLDSVSVGVIFVDTSLRIKSFTAQVKAVVNLLPSDVGRPLRDITTRLQVGDLSEDTCKVLDTFQAVEKEVRTETGEWYFMRARPYRTSENVIGGVVITLNDVTSFKKASEERAAANVIRAVVDTVKEPLLTLSSDLKIVTANQAFYRLFNLEEHSAEGKPLYEVAGGELDVGELRRLLEQVFFSNTVVKDYPVSLKAKDKEPVTLLLNAQTLMTPEKEKMPFILISIRHSKGG
jgi:two-component system CheB/CheR fusion protein